MNLDEENFLTKFRMGIFGAANGWGEGGGEQKGPPSLKFVTHMRE